MSTQLAQAGLNLLIAACLGAVIGLERQMAPASRGLADQYAGRARGRDFRDLFPCRARWRRRHAHCRPGRLGDRLSRRWRNLQGGSQRTGPQHRRDPLVIGGGRPACRRGDCALRPFGRRPRARGQHRAEADRPRHQPTTNRLDRRRAKLPRVDRLPRGARIRHQVNAGSGVRCRARHRF
jgi:hypothetical protein